MRVLLLVCLLATACRPALQDDVRALAARDGPAPDVPLAAVRFERCGAPLLGCVRAEQLLAAGAGMENRWPQEARRSQSAARQRGEEWTPDEVFFLDHGIRSRAARLDEDLHFFFTQGGRTGPYELVYADVQERRPVVVDSLEPTYVGDEPIGVAFGAFDVAPRAERLLVVYGTPSDAYGSPSFLRQVWGTPTEKGLELSPPEVIFEGGPGDRRIFDVQLLESEGRVDLLWQTGERLVFSSLARDESTWTAGQVLSDSSNARSASLISDGPRVYVAWSDGRYESMEGWAPVNGRKLMLRHSTDGGTSFGEPVLLGSRDRKADSFDRTLLAPGPDGPVLFAWGEGTERWERFQLDGDLLGYALLEPLPSPELEAAYQARLRPLLERRD